MSGPDAWRGRRPRPHPVAIVLVTAVMLASAATSAYFVWLAFRGLAWLVL